MTQSSKSMILFYSPIKNERVMLHRQLLLAFAFNDIMMLYTLFNYSRNTHGNIFKSILDPSIQVQIIVMH